MNYLTDKVQPGEVKETTIANKIHIGKRAVYFRANPFDFKINIHKREHWLEDVLLIGIEEKLNCYLVQHLKTDKKEKIHASKIIRIQTEPIITNQLELF